MGAPFNAHVAVRKFKGALWSLDVVALDARASFTRPDDEVVKNTGAQAHPDERLPRRLLYQNRKPQSKPGQT